MEREESSETRSVRKTLEKYLLYKIYLSSVHRIMVGEYCVLLSDFSSFNLLAMMVGGVFSVKQ